MLSGCLLSSQPLITDADSILPFGDYTVFQEESKNSQTGKLERGSRVAFERNGNGYIMRSIETGGMSAFDGQKIMLSQLGSGTEGAAYVAQMFFKGNDEDGPPMWMYMMLLRWNTGKLSMFTFQKTLDCSKIPNDLLPKIRPRSVSVVGCSVASLDGLKALLIRNIQQDVFGDSSGYSLVQVTN